MTDTPHRPGRAALAGSALTLLTLIASAWYLSAAPTIVGEEHLQIAEHFRSTGILSIDGTPAFFRPPGFPVFAAGVLFLRDAFRPGVEGARAVALAHAVLLALGGLAVFASVARSQKVAVAFAAGALFALHPLNLFIAQSVNYPTLHIVTVTLATLALSHALAGGRHRAAWALAAGVLWGVATLVRPVSLILPPFVLLLARWHAGDWVRALRFAAVFTAGMGAVIAPWTVRNYRLSDRLVVVNAQDGWAFWALSASREGESDGAAWNRMWRDEGAPLFQRVTGVPYSLDVLYRNVLVLNDAYRAEAAANIREDPRAFAATVARNVYAFNTDTMAWWVDTFSDGTSTRRDVVARALTWAVLLLGLVGLLRGLRAGDPHARTLAVVYAMFCVAHGMAFQLARYNYVRLPLAMLALPLAFSPRQPRP